MKLEKIIDGVYHIRGKNRYELSSSFMRMQEFYESPFHKIRNKLFTLEQYMDMYAEEYGNFTYYSDWDGFNVPGIIIRKFFTTYVDNLLEKEKSFYKLIKDVVESNEKFYLIGTYQDGAVVDHELAHAFFYLDSKYKKAMNMITNSIPTKIQKNMLEELFKKGYCKQVQTDELQAYCSTSSMIELTEEFESVDIPWETILKYKKIFADAKDQKFSENE